MDIVKLFKEKELNVLKTLWFNFRYLPFSQALKLPIYLYGKFSIPNCRKGRINLKPTFISQGMIMLGCYKSQDLYGHKTTHTTILNIQGQWVLKGAFMLSNGSVLAIGPLGLLETGHDVAIGPCSRLYCTNSIILGKRIRASWDVQIFDTNFHYTIKDGRISKNKACVKVGNYCWIANRVSLMPKTNLPDHSVVASNSMVNKDFSEISPKSLFAGSPAKHILTGIQRIFADGATDALFDDLFSKSDKQSFDANDDSVIPILQKTLNYKDGES